METQKVTLNKPIKRGDTEITELTLRKPKGGELRGLSIAQIQIGDVNAHITLIPRIATPFVTEHDIAELESDDLADVVDTAVGFFMTKAARAQLRNPSTN